MDSVSSYQGRHVPTSLLVAAAVVALEGLGSIAFGITEVLHTTSERMVMGATTSLFFLAYGGGMILCAWGLTRLHTWARGPVLIVQLISLGLAWNFREGDTKGISVLLMVPAIVVIIAMLNRSTLRALDGSEGPDGPDDTDRPE